MAKIRTIKPEFFRHETLYEAESASQLPLRLAFAGLFTCCDREGRFRWRPRQLKLDILPYDDVDFSRVLDALSKRGFVVRYEVSGEIYGYIPSWHKHQHINNKEMTSDLPAPEGNRVVMKATSISENENTINNNHLVTCGSRVTHASLTPDQSTLECLRNSAVEMEMEVEEEGKWKDQGRALEAISSPPSAVITIPLNDSTEFLIFQSQVDEWQTLYPAINVMQMLRNIRAWNLANPKRRKTRSGILKHVTYWLANEQNNPNSSIYLSRGHYAKSQTYNAKGESMLRAFESCVPGINWRDECEAQDEKIIANASGE